MKVCVERRQQCSPKHVTFGHQHTHERIDVINEILSTPTLLPLRILPNSEILRIIVRGSQKCDGEILRTSEFAHYRERGSPGYRSQKAEVRIAGLQNIFTHSPPPSIILSSCSLYCFAFQSFFLLSSESGVAKLLIKWLLVGTLDGNPRQGSHCRKLAGQNILISHMPSRK